MVTRHDAVLAAIPAVAAVGVLLDVSVRALGTTAALGGPVPDLPLWIVGFLGALALIAHEMLTLPVEE